MLYDILRNRECVNLLKKLSDSKKIIDSDKLGFSDKAIELLYKNNLIHIERKERLYVTISLKGQNFIRLFDDIRSLFDEKAKNNRKLIVDYSLSPKEKELILTISKSLYEINVDKLFKVMKKKKVYKVKKSFTKDLALLDELNLTKTFNEKTSLTEIGKKVITHEVLKEYNLLE